MGTTAGVRSGARARWLTRQAPDMALASRRGVAQRRGCLLGNDPEPVGELSPRRFAFRVVCQLRHLLTISSMLMKCLDQIHIDILRPQPNKNMTACTKVPTHQLQRIKFNNSPATHRVQLIEFQPDLLIQVTIIPSMLNNNAAVQLLNNKLLCGKERLPRLIRARPNTRNRARTCRPAGGWGLGGGAGRELTKPATTICSSAVGGLVDKKTRFPMEQTTVAADWPFETQDP